jgi:hypothetical protein
LEILRFDSNVGQLILGALAESCSAHNFEVHAIVALRLKLLANEICVTVIMAQYSSSNFPVIG